MYDAYVAAGLSGVISFAAAYGSFLARFNAHEKLDEERNTQTQSMLTEIRADIKELLKGEDFHERER